MSLPNLEELAKQGDAKAITALLNDSLESQGITAKASLNNDDLYIVLEAAETPSQTEAIALISEVITSLQPGSIEAVTVDGRQIGSDTPAWHQQFFFMETPPQLATDNATTEEPFSLDTFTKKVAEVSESIGNTTSVAGKTMAQRATGVGEVVGKTTWATGKVFVDKATGVGKAVGETFRQAGKAMSNTAAGVGEALADIGATIGNHTSRAGKTAVNTAVGVGGTALRQTYQLLSQITQFVAGVPILGKILDQVDVVKAQNAVKKLQKKYPQETPRQISHRIMVEKAVYAGSSGLVTSLVPGAAAALFAVDLTATAALQGEMVYQIAAVYGLDLEDPARKGEALTIFGLALGGNRAIRAALEVLQNTPVAGAFIGASTNAAMIYSVGYAACRFYEAKLDEQDMGEALFSSQEASQDYLKTAIEQQIIMDQILVHVIAAGNPDKSWSDLLPDLEALHISPASLAVIKAHLQSPPPLEQLLDQLNHDFAMPLLAQCQQVARQDGTATPEEAEVIDKISHKFNIDLKALQPERV